MKWLARASMLLLFTAMVKDKSSNMDAHADAFSKGGQGAAKSSIDYEANALMSGIGAGLKGSASK
jgi:hypothetical protein